MFRIKATFQGIPVEFEWDDGVLLGSPRAMGLAKNFVSTARDYGAACGPYYHGEDVFKDELASWVMINQCFDDVRLVGGQMPSAPDLPEGAIA